MLNLSELFVLDGLEVARRVTEQFGECVPTLFILRAGARPDWAHPVTLTCLSDYARVAERAGAASAVLIWSHVYHDDTDAQTKLTQLYAAFVNATGQVLRAAKRQRWDDDPGRTLPSVLDGPLLQLTTGWVM